MSNAADDQTNFPTMIIPRGTEIRINSSGQLSIKTPGNLVIQNSGVYSEIESTNGSIRIESNVNVEAVTVRAAQACFVQGTLTAWRVHAKKIALEDKAKAYIMLQESEQLELSRGSRLVGNFANEKEIYLMLGKFTPQLKELPGSVDLHAGSSAIETPRTNAGFLGDETNPRPEAAATDPLARALQLLDRELQRYDLDQSALGTVREVAFSLREKDLQRAKLIYRDAFSELRISSDGLRQAFELIDQYFRDRG